MPLSEASALEHPNMVYFLKQSKAICLLPSVTESHLRVPAFLQCLLLLPLLGHTNPYTSYVPKGSCCVMPQAMYIVGLALLQTWLS